MTAETEEPDDADEPEREWRACRLCHGEDLLPDESHECRYADYESMPQEAESALLAALIAAPIDLWNGPSSPWAVDVFELGGWRVAVFFDGPDFESWDYVDHVIAPDGLRYNPWPAPGERALPMSIANWRPARMGPDEDWHARADRTLQRIRDFTNALMRRK